MKTCIKYWGGKQQLAPEILRLIPEHHTYCEPFFGGGAVFFAKAPSKNEAINDISDNIVNFYRVVKRADTFERLCQEIDLTLYSEWQYKKAKAIWKAGKDDCKVMRAWAVFVLSHQSFSADLGCSWIFNRNRNNAMKFDRVKKMFDERYVRRLERTQIFQRDALNVMANMDSPDTFHFIDPPYFNADMGHYKGYTEADFKALLDLLVGIQGKFLLTTYPSDVLTKHTEENGWLTINNEVHLCSSNTAGKSKVEVFTLNYTPQEGQLRLFG